MSVSRDTEAALRITAVPIDTAAAILAKAGAGNVTADMLRADVEAGAPTNADGTLNLVHYAAWLVKEVASRGD